MRGLPFRISHARFVLEQFLFFSWPYLSQKALEKPRNSDHMLERLALAKVLGTRDVG